MRRLLPPYAALAFVACIATAATAGCGREGRTPAPRRPEITGAGATFPYPLYARWTARYLTAADVRVNYYSVGSAEGIRLLAQGAVDFGASDVPLSPTARDTVGCGGVIQLPTVAGAVAVAYRLPGVDTLLTLDVDALAQIFRGRVTRWNAPAIQRRNPGVRLPDLPIRVVHRSAGSGTSAAFARYLATSPFWDGARRGNAEWPVGTSEEGNEGVAARISQTAGAIGYVEIAYARQNLLKTARLVARSGQVVPPSADAVRAALSALGPVVPDTVDVILDAPADGAYPVVALSWFVIARQQPDRDKRDHLTAFLRWAMHEGAAEAGALEYVPLPPALLVHYDSLVGQLTVGRCPRSSRP